MSPRLFRALSEDGGRAAGRLGSHVVNETLRRCGHCGGIRSHAGANRRTERAALTRRAVLEAMSGRFDTARDLIPQARTLAEELGLEAMLACHVATGAADIELLAGDATAAERLLRPACETLERVGELSYLPSAAPLLADALYVQARNEEEFLLTERWTPQQLTVRRMSMLMPAGGACEQSYSLGEATSRNSCGREPRSRCPDSRGDKIAEVWLWYDGYDQAATTSSSRSTSARPSSSAVREFLTDAARRTRRAGSWTRRRVSCAQERSRHSCDLHSIA